MNYCKRFNTEKDEYFHLRSQCLSVNSRNTRARRRIFSKLIIKPPERRHMGTSIANSEQILQPIIFISWVCIKVLFRIFFVNNYQFKANNRNTTIMSEIRAPEQRCIALKTPEQNVGWVATS